MGTSKAMLYAGGRTFLERLIQTHQAGGCAQVLVALPTLDGPEAVAAADAGARVVKNPSPEEGPIGSLRTTLKVLDDSVDGILFCPVDHPLILEDTVRLLIEAFRQSKAPLVVPTLDGKRGHPVLFGRALFDELLNDVLAEGARTVVHRHLDETVSVPIDDSGTIIDIDDMTQYELHYPDEYRLHSHRHASSSGLSDP
jgi:molybdenum cofactor cytidylyltransferase